MRIKKRNVNVKYGKFQVCVNEDIFEDLEVEQPKKSKWFSSFLTGVGVKLTATAITALAVYAYTNRDYLGELVSKLISAFVL